MLAISHKHPRSVLSLRILADSHPVLPTVSAVHHRIAAAASTGGGKALEASPTGVKAKEFAGDPIMAMFTEAPGNHAAIGGLKVTTENGWFAARPSGTEDVYKIYAESFHGEEHLKRIQTEAQALVTAAIA